LLRAGSSDEPDIATIPCHLIKYYSTYDEIDGQYGIYSRIQELVRAHGILEPAIFSVVPDEPFRSIQTDGEDYMARKRSFRSTFPGHPATTKRKYGGSLGGSVKSYWIFVDEAHSFLFKAQQCARL
jgi:hypothetical protein